MTVSGTQLSLDYMDVKSEASLLDFESVGFAPVLSAIHDLLDGDVREMYVYGDTGSGKSHLMTAIFNAYQQRHGMAMMVSLEEMIATDVQALTGLEMFNLIILDDVHLAQPYPEWQEALFHLINRSRAMGRQIVYTATTPPAEVEFELPDLVTRLSQSLIFGLPDGTNVEDRHALLKSILRQKGWQLPQSIVDELVQSGPYHVGDMLTVVGNIVPYFGYKNRWRLSPKMLEQIKSAIKEQSLLVELADINFDDDDVNDNLNLPYL